MMSKTHGLLAVATFALTGALWSMGGRAQQEPPPEGVAAKAGEKIDEVGRRSGGASRTPKTQSEMGSIKPAGPFERALPRRESRSREWVFCRASTAASIGKSP
jgi:hypothetical protein